MYDITNIEEFAKHIFTAVTQSEYAENVTKEEIPQVVLVDELLLANMPWSSLRELLKSFFSSEYRGLTIRYSEHEDGIFNSDNNILHLNEGDIVVFVHEEFSENQILSTVTHELMHSLFHGIPNSTPEGNGYNEACTDYLASKFYGEDYYSTYFDKRGQKGYMVYYDRFKYEFDESQRQNKLNEYFNIS